jgi:hypothetical protein
MVKQQQEERDMSKTKAAAAVAPKMDMKVLAGQVDRLGDVRAEKSKLEKEEKDIKKILDPFLKEIGDTLSGRKYEAVVVIPDARIPNNAKIIKEAGIDWFIANASVALGTLEDKFGNEEIDRIVTLGKGAKRISTKKL